MKRLYIITVLVALLSVSCNDWLDVRPDTEQKDKDLFTTYKFQDALTGCYMSLASQDVYGERLTMSNIESLANLWYQFRNSTRYEDNDLMNHDYTGDYSKTAVKTIYAGLFNVIAQANMIIKYAEKNGDVIDDPAAYHGRGVRHSCFLPVGRAAFVRTNATGSLPASGITLF